MLANCRVHNASGMPEPAQAAPEKPSGSFASVLASFAGRLPRDSWDDSALADDVAILTYEQALRSTRRPRMPETATNRAFEKGGQISLSESSPPKSEQSEGKKQRSASITIRVTAEEHAQLHERAAAAQLSVSAYLRSCILEAESLRGQVKEALAQMQSAQKHISCSTVRTSSGWRNWQLPAWLQHKMRRTIA